MPRADADAALPPELFDIFAFFRHAFFFFTPPIFAR